MDKDKLRQFDSSRVCPDVLRSLKELANNARKKDGSLSPEVIENLRGIAKEDRESHAFNVLNLVEPLFPSI